MSTEQLSDSKKEQNRYAPTELAPFRDFAGMPSIVQFRQVNDLSEYLEDPTTARASEIQRYGIYDRGIPGSFYDIRLETELANATLDKLDEIAAHGSTFLVQHLAKGLADSPLARAFDRRPGRQLNLPREKWEHRREYDEKGVPKAPDKDMYERFFASVPTREETGERVFADAERELAQAGYLKVGALEGDEKFLAYKEQGNFVAMQGRMWHMAYEMPKEDQEAKVLPYTYEMTAYGDIGQNEVSDDFYQKFISVEPIEYKEIKEAGLLYVPVQTSSDTIGFFEESGRCVALFRTPNGLHPGDTATDFNVDERAAELLVNASEEEIFETSQAHFLLMGNLQMRHILEQSLDVRLSDFTVDDQIFLSKLLIKATPRQMEAVVAHGSETIKNVARALEFGDDYANKILSVAEHASPEQAGKIFETINEFRDSSAKFAGLFGDFDPSFAGATERATNERLTDELYSVQQIVKDGRLEVDVAPHRNSPDYENDGRFMAEEDSLEDGIYLLEHTKKTPELIANILTAPDAVVSKAAEGSAASFAIYRVVSETYGQMLVYVREYGGERFDRGFEYGNRDGVEASASFMVDPADPHRHLNISKDPGAVSLRFDRQGFGVDESPFIEERSPIREKGSISLDISSGMGDPSKLPVRIGRFVAAGNLLRAEEVGSAESLHHNMNGFDQEKYGSVEGFAEVPRYIKRTLEAMMVAHRDRKLGSLASRRRNTPSDYSEAA